MKKKISEWFSLLQAKNPGSVVLMAILLFNVLFLFVSAAIISNFSLAGTEEMGFLESAFCTITMILDAGCIQFVIADIGSANVAVAVTCLLIILIGMVSFTGAVIGYITNYISDFISSANDGKRRLNISGHTVILNWNSRASEIVNDLLYCDSPQKVVILVSSRKEKIIKEINEHLADTISKENSLLMESLKDCSGIERLLRFRRERLRNNITFVVREGDVFSSRQLRDISLEHAKSILILSSDGAGCTAQHRGNPLTIKTLMQVADITGAEESDDNQRIIVEITDSWTNDLVDRIILAKQVDGKSNIVPFRVHKIMGQILAQFCIMPELNLVYRELFSNKGAAFFSREIPADTENPTVDYLRNHPCAVPLADWLVKDRRYQFYTAASMEDILREEPISPPAFTAKLNPDYRMPHKHVFILGHNSKCRYLMEGFAAFCSEWNDPDTKESLLSVVVIDDRENLEAENYYRDYPFVVRTIEAGTFDTDIIGKAIGEVVNRGEEVSTLILSNDAAQDDEIDADALTNLVYGQQFNRKRALAPKGTYIGSNDMIVEIIDPKHSDIVSSYSVNNVVISNRYLSKMASQLGEKDVLASFYTDLLTYDTDGTQVYESKEIYLRPASQFFQILPPPCTANDLIRSVYYASPKENPCIILGIIDSSKKMTLFQGDQRKIPVSLSPDDKLIIYCNH